MEFKVWRDFDCIRWWDLYSSNWKDLGHLGDLDGSKCFNLILEAGRTWKVVCGKTRKAGAEGTLILLVSFCS
ncbi:hypothetical protein DPMN_114377 [Dreissena polymorpha]|uniref:Uncharacterized protein n=1 Tax=Dreissena polymorpha TaxID=45954 RepID=A0A9D4KK15_DREPO|nr:hypothetical protein DPMN_114377 [Dreissena polymorpha]